MEEILERQLLIRGRAFATFSTIEKALARCMLCRPGLEQTVSCSVDKTFSHNNRGMKNCVAFS